MKTPRLLDTALAGLFRALVSRPGAERRVATITEDLTLFRCQRAHRQADEAARRKTLRRTVRRIQVGHETHILA
jgi:hypothetical protein